MNLSEIDFIQVVVRIRGKYHMVLLNEGIARIIFSLIPRRAFDSPLRHSLIEDVLYGRFDEACESLEAWIAKAEKEAENANH